jgi:hypothetical protein
MVRRSNQYAILKAALESGTIEAIKDIQQIVPITVLTDDMELNYNTLSKRLLDPARFTVADISRLSTLVGVDPGEMFLRILKEVPKKER